jgi:hypothetical protein
MVLLMVTTMFGSPGTTKPMARWSFGAAFAALRRDGKVVSWGLPHAGGDSSAVLPVAATGVLGHGKVQQSVRILVDISRYIMEISWRYKGYIISWKYHGDIMEISWRYGGDIMEISLFLNVDGCLWLILVPS